MPREIAKSYSHQQVEGEWYARWEAADHFAPAGSGAPSFSMVIPPPNVTGSLHMGHALNNTLQDVLCRFRRMDGHDVLWVPGTDHAGIATQNVVERQLAEEGRDRGELGREAFIEKVWSWREETGHTILRQLRAWAFPATGAASASPWTRPFPGGARSLRAPLGGGAALSRRTAHQLVPALQDGAGRHRGGARGSGRPPVARPLSAGGGGRGVWWPPRVPRPCSATPASRSIPRTRATPAISAGARGCPSWAGRSRWWPTLSWTRNSAPARSRSPPDTTSTTSRSVSGMVWKSSISLMMMPP